MRNRFVAGKSNAAVDVLGWSNDAVAAFTH